MDILNLTPGGFASNCYLVKCGNDAVLIDCTADAHRVSEALGDAKLHAILLTHGHFDHMLTVSRIQRELSAPLYLHARDAEFPTDARKNAFAAFFPQDVTYPTRRSPALRRGMPHVRHTLCACNARPRTYGRLRALPYGRGAFYGRYDFFSGLWPHRSVRRRRGGASHLACAAAHPPPDTHDLSRARRERLARRCT